MKNNKVSALYTQLLAKHGTPAGQWALWCKRPKTAAECEQVIIESILTQRTNWKNVELAMANLRNAGIIGLKEIYKKGAKEITPLIKPSGFYVQKSVYLSRLAKFIIENYGTLELMQKESIEKLREELLTQRGVGPETADSILLYALEKPVFVIDEYTRRIAKAKGINGGGAYYTLQKIFEENTEKNHELYQDFHALIVIEGKASKEN